MVDNRRYLFTSESVTEGHPDKVADAISDAVLDLYLSRDKNARVACETLVTSNLCVLAGEVRSEAIITKEEIELVVRETIKNIGYTDPKDEFSYDTVEIINKLHMQSTDIAMGVDNSLENKESSAEEFVEGAGDQGMMFGYATNETEELMPYAISLAHKLTRRLTDLRTSGKIKWLKPDGKSQVTVEYDEDNVVKRIEAIVVSTMHTDDIEIDELRRVIRGEVIDKVINNNLIDENTKIYINPTGRFVIGGPHGDTGLTGRKIIVDTYGGKAPHGGGAFSGKDSSKVDRSGAYMARHIAASVVGSGLAGECTVQLSYAIGVAEPTSVLVNTHGTSKKGYSDRDIEKIVREKFDLRPGAIVKSLRLKRPIYKKTTNYGHFGKTYLPWENITWLL